MSIRRIESSFAQCDGDTSISGPVFATLLGLAYCANERNNEACFPSVKRLSELMHFSCNTVTRAINNLIQKGLVERRSGGLRKNGGTASNHYKFLFPHKKLTSRWERYHSIEDSVDNSGKMPLAQLGPLSLTVGGPPPQSGGGGTPPPQWGGPHPHRGALNRKKKS